MDAHRATHGVEPMCKALHIAPSGYRKHAARLRQPELRCERAKKDEQLVPRITEVWQSNMSVYGADKVRMQLKRE